jgi:hypothetical protein
MHAKNDDDDDDDDSSNNNNVFFCLSYHDSFIRDIPAPPPHAPTLRCPMFSTSYSISEEPR